MNLVKFGSDALFFQKIWQCRSNRKILF